MQTLALTLSKMGVWVGSEQRCELIRLCFKTIVLTTVVWGSQMEKARADTWRPVKRPL